MRVKTLGAFLLSLVVILSSIPVYAEGTPVTHYQLDTGCVFIWCNSVGKWQNELRPDGPSTSGATINITGVAPKDRIANVQVYPYHPEALKGKPGIPEDFNFNNTNVFHWNSTQFASDKRNYDRFYYTSSALPKDKSVSYDKKTGNVNITRKVTLTTTNGGPIDVKNKLAIDLQGGAADIYSMMGYTEATASPDIKKAMTDLYPKSGQSPNVKGYLYFIPMVIQYDVLPDDPVLPLMPPKVGLDCKTSSAFIGMNTGLTGYIKNQNTYPVIMQYWLTVNGVKRNLGTVVLKAGQVQTVTTSFNVPYGTKPGTLYTFQLHASNIGKEEDPPERYRIQIDSSKLSGDYSEAEWKTLLDQAGSRLKEYYTQYASKYETAGYLSYMSNHAQDPVTKAWYRTDTQWKGASSNVCKRTAVPQPTAPVDHGLKPTVIIE